MPESFTSRFLLGQSACTFAEPKIDPKEIADFSEMLEADRATIASVSGDPSLLDAAVKALKGCSWKASGPLIGVVEVITRYVAALPEPSKEDEARDFIIVAQERYDRCRTTTNEKGAAAKRSELSAKISEVSQRYFSTAYLLQSQVACDEITSRPQRKDIFWRQMSLTCPRRLGPYRRRPRRFLAWDNGAFGELA